MKLLFKQSIALLVFVNIGIQSYSQTDFQNFKKLSSPKKTWVFFHVFKAKKALKISKEANRISDSILKTNLLDRDHAGGQVDAFRHAYWMARLHQEIGKSAARSLGKRHEQENYLMYKAQKLEEGTLPDACSKEMDLFNNEIGISLTNRKIIVSREKLIEKVIKAIKQGRMKVIKKNRKGEFLTRNGTVLTSAALKGKWENDKCLVRSNYIRK